MRSVIVAFSNQEHGETVRDILARCGFTISALCRFGAETIRAANSHDGGIIICGVKLSDCSALELREMLPNGYSMLVLKPSKYAGLDLGGDIYSLTLPVEKNVLANTVNVLISQSEKPVVKPRAEARSDADIQLIKTAKEVLMSKNGFDEDKAHKFLQKLSMNKGIKLTEAAKSILEEWHI